MLSLKFPTTRFQRLTQRKMLNNPVKLDGRWWLIPVILAIQEAETRRITI
jgi:hypothetical protein